jgi:DNA topoisomerase-1
VNVMIVETPAKGRTLAPFLGKDWRIEACYGSLRNFPEDELGIDVARDFRPTFRLLPGMGGRLRKLSAALRSASAVYLATDPDEGGDLTAWHLIEQLNLPPECPILRLNLQALTADAVRAALRHARPLDQKRVEAALARATVDRLFSHLVLPLASRGLNDLPPITRAGAVALRLIAEREQMAVESQPMWTLHARFDTDGGTFDAALYTLKHGQAHLANPTQAEKLRHVLAQAVFQVAQAAETTRVRLPLAPFTTTTLLQNASGELGLPPDQTRALAHALYTSGAITFPETASSRIAPEAVTAAHAYIRHTYGDAYVGDAVDTADEAGEAIRPTDVHRLPETVSGGEGALYGLIWRRFIEAHMAPAQYRLCGARILAGKTAEQPYPVDFRVQEMGLSFAGFLALHGEPVADESAFPVISHLRPGQPLTLAEVRVEPYPARRTLPYTRSLLISVLAARGLPLNAADELTARGYLRAEAGQLMLTENGQRLYAALNAHFAPIINDDMTERLTAGIAQIAVGGTDRLTVVRAFWEALQPCLRHASEGMGGALAVVPEHVEDGDERAT